jgi:coniferyl-aldehyde dehydrogenase
MGPDTNLTQVYEAQKRAHAADPSPGYELRRDRLRRLLALTDEAEAQWVKAIDADFGGRPSQETRMAELFIIRASVRHALAHLRQWMRTRRVKTDLHFLPGRNRILPQPLGVVGVVAPWNYPYQLSVGPTVGAVAAGNRVMIKPSEFTPRFAEELAQQVARRFAPDELAVLVGDVDLARAFVTLPFDHLVFTGSTAVGREVAKAAAANLTPVTLELGGKSPAIVDASADFAAAARSIAAGKLLNAGQTCIAPDHALVPRGRAEEFAQQLGTAMAGYYPSFIGNPDYAAIISARHRDRLETLVREAEAAGAKVITVNPAGESAVSANRKMLPVLVLRAPAQARLMREEIFGPVLPVLEVDGCEGAIAHVNRGDRPLALYWFGRDAGARDRVLRETISGGVTVNDTLWHLAQESQPFGGVGASGIGAYHGEWGFRALSKEKPVFYQAPLNGAPLLRPPYGRVFEQVLGILNRIV